MKTYYIQFLDSREETVKASSVRITAKMVSFYRKESLVLAAPASEITRIAETPFKSYEELEHEKTQKTDKKLEPIRAMIREIQARSANDEKTREGRNNKLFPPRVRTGS